MKTKFLALLALTCAYAGAQNVQRTQLANTVADTTTTQVYVYSTVIPVSLAQGYIYVDSEAMQVVQSAFAPSALNNLVSLTVVRGIMGTSAASHTAGITTFYALPSQFITFDLAGGCNPAGPQYVNVLDQMLFSCGPDYRWVGITTAISGGGSGGSGTVTNIATSAPLTGGPISTTGTLGCRTATGSLSGCLSPTDWTTFNAKQAAGSYLTGIGSGDGTTAGAPSAALTLSTVNSNVGTFGSSTNCITLTVNGKGLITAASQTACAGGGGSGWTITTIAGLPGTCPSAGAGYFATDAPPGQQLYLCADNASAPYQFLNLGGSTCLAFTAASLDIVTACIPQKTLANDFTALNRFGAIAGIGSAPTRTNVTGTVAVNAGSTNASGTITSSTSGTVLFTFTMAGVTFATRPVCMFHDDTTNADQIGTTQSTPPTTSAMTVTGTTASGDIISYICIGY